MSEYDFIRSCFNSDMMETILKVPGILQTVDDRTLANAAVLSGDGRKVELFLNQEKFNCWNIADEKGDTPIMTALKYGKVEVVEVLMKYSRVDLNVRDTEGWTLLMRAIAGKKIGES